MILNIAIGVYGGLSVLAALLQGKYKNISLQSALVLGFGGLLMLSTLFINGTLSIYVLAAGALLIHVSAIINGIKMFGEVNKKHHVIRFGISALLVVSQFLSVRGA